MLANIEYRGQVAVVTGAGRGLGRSHAGLLAARGARGIVNDVAGADDAVDEIPKSGGEATASFDDISTPEGAASLVRGAIDTYGTIDILIDNAAIGRFTTMRDATIEEYELVTAARASNVGGPLLSPGSPNPHVSALLRSPGAETIAS